MKRLLAASVTTALVLSCSSSASDAPTEPSLRLPYLLEQGEAIFGLRAGPFTREDGIATAKIGQIDFVYHVHESGPLDLAAIQAYRAGMATAAGKRGAHPMALMLPNAPRDELAPWVRQGIGAGFEAVGLRNAETVADVEHVVRLVKGDDREVGAASGGPITTIVFIQSQVGFRNAVGIVGTPGIDIVIPWPPWRSGMEREEIAQFDDHIDQVLDVCMGIRVACGISVVNSSTQAYHRDISARLEQGFSVILPRHVAGLEAGWAVSGRTGLLRYMLYRLFLTQWKCPPNCLE